MELQLLASYVLLLVLFLGPDIGVAQTLRNFRSKNGIRLAGSSGPQGRLEISSTDSWFTTVPGKASWSPVCDSSSFTDDDALIMCRMLNYTYGRKFYSPSIAYRKNETGVRYIGAIQCDERIFSPPPPARSPPPLRSPPPSLSLPPPPASSPPPADPSTSVSPPPTARRLLIGDSTEFAAAGTDMTDVKAVARHGSLAHRQQQQRRRLRQGKGQDRARALFSPLYGTIAAPRSAPYSCNVKPGACDAKGPFVGIQCSHTPMENAPPPPPSPPAPPPSPPAVSERIRWYGPAASSYGKTQGDVEPNLVDYGSGLGTFYGRFEVQVTVNGSLVWAPLCAPSDEALDWGVAYIACQQYYDWPVPYVGSITLVMSQVGEENFNIPEAAVNPGDFDPEKVPAWVSVIGGSANDKSSIQDFELKITPDPCETGAMFAAVCIPY